jgi:protein TonB
MFANFATAITSGTVITMALFYVMNLLIAIQPGATFEPTPSIPIDWIHVAPPEEPPIVTARQFKRPEPLTLPPIDTSRSEPGESVINVGRPAPPPPGPGLQRLTSISPDGPLVVMVRVRPVYPAVAAQRGLSGFCAVQFDVLADGSVTNIQVIESSHSLFEASATRAAQRFRYKPRIVDGIAQITSGVRYLFTFEMEDNN